MGYTEAFKEQMVKRMLGPPASYPSGPLHLGEANVMAEQHRSRGVGEGGGMHLAGRRSALGRQWWLARVVVLVLLGLQTACAMGYPMGGMLAGGARHRWRVQRA